MHLQHRRVGRVSAQANLRSKLNRVAVAVAKTPSNNSKKLFDKDSRISAQAHIGAADVKLRSSGRSQNPLEQLKEVIR